MCSSKIGGLRDTISTFLSFLNSTFLWVGGVLGLEAGIFQVAPFESPNEMTSPLGTHQRWQLAEALVPHTWSLGDCEWDSPRAATQTKGRWCERRRISPSSEWRRPAQGHAGKSSFNSMQNKWGHFYALGRQSQALLLSPGPLFYSL